MPYGGYDPYGNLFVDGMQGGNLVFAELPHAGDALTNIPVNQSFHGASSLQSRPTQQEIGRIRLLINFRFPVSDEEQSTSRARILTATLRASAPLRHCSQGAADRSRRLARRARYSGQRDHSEPRVANRG